MRARERAHSTLPDASEVRGTARRCAQGQNKGCCRVFRHAGSIPVSCLTYITSVVVCNVHTAMVELMHACGDNATRSASAQKTDIKGQLRAEFELQGIKCCGGNETSVRKPVAHTDHERRHVQGGEIQCCSHRYFITFTSLYSLKLKLRTQLTLDVGYLCLEWLPRRWWRWVGSPSALIFG